MAAKKKTDAQPECCSGSACKVESIVTVDERGQILLPKDTREKAEIHAGDKLALMTWENNGKVCCFMLLRPVNWRTWRRTYWAAGERNILTAIFISPWDVRGKRNLLLTLILSLKGEANQGESKWNR